MRVATANFSAFSLHSSLFFRNFAPRYEDSESADI